jgi:hypothetical protein
LPLPSILQGDINSCSALADWCWAPEFGEESLEVTVGFVAAFLR